MFAYREQCKYVVRNYVLLQGDRVLSFGVFCLLTVALIALGHNVMWVPVDSWSPWSHLAILLYCFGAYWTIDEQCEATYGRVGESVDEPPTVRGRLILGVVLTAVLVAGDLLGSSLGAIELTGAAWIFGHCMLGGRLRRLYIVVGILLALTGGYHMLGAIFDELEANSSPWFVAIAGMVIVLRAVSDQGTFRDTLKSARVTGDYDV